MSWGARFYRVETGEATGNVRGHALAWRRPGMIDDIRVAERSLLSTPVAVAGRAIPYAAAGGRLADNHLFEGLLKQAIATNRFAKIGAIRDGQLSAEI